MRRWMILLGLVLVWLAWPSAAMAHVGAPYPVLLEEPAGPYVVSALADPDVGTGTFFTLVTLAGGDPPPAGTAVMVWVKPEDGHLVEAGYLAERQRTRYGERFVAKVPFDAAGPWQVRLVLQGPTGSGEIAFPVRVTPAGIGWLPTLACLLPFLIVGLLWLRATRRQRSARQS